MAKLFFISLVTIGSFLIVFGFAFLVKTVQFIKKQIRDEREKRVKEYRNNGVLN